MSKFFSNEDAKTDDDEAKTRHKMSHSGLLSGSFDTSMVIRALKIHESVHERIQNLSWPEVQRLGGLNNHRSAEYLVAGDLLFDILEAFKINTGDTADGFTTTKQAMLVLIGAYIEEYNRLKKGEKSEE